MLIHVSASLSHVGDNLLVGALLANDYANNCIFIWYIFRRFLIQALLLMVPQFKVGHSKDHRKGFNVNCFNGIYFIRIKLGADDKFKAFPSC